MLRTNLVHASNLDDFPRGKVDVHEAQNGRDSSRRAASGQSSAVSHGKEVKHQQERDARQVNAHHCDGLRPPRKLRVEHLYYIRVRVGQRCFNELRK